MQEYIQKNGEEVAIVIYDAPLPPKYFRLSKKFIRHVFVVFPLLFVGVIVAFFVWGLGTRLGKAPAPSLPSIMTDSESKLVTLENEIKSLEQSNKELSNKLAAGAATGSGAEEPYLMMIKKPYGMQNFTAENRVTLDQFDLVQENNSVKFKFQIISTTDTKVTGHIIVFMISHNGILGYPAEINNYLAQGAKYSLGEPFSVSRLRPTVAEFKHIYSEESVKFVIYILSREGDLLLTRETEAFKLGPK